jgi:hypothetical protein
MAISQKKINLESLSNRIMLLLVQFQARTQSGSLDDGLVWTTNMIAGQLRIPTNDVSVALIGLLKLGYVEQRGKEWVKTVDGETLFLEEIRDARIRTSSVEFREEALTGMTKCGNESKLTRAALPSLSEQSHRNKEEDAIIEVSMRSSAIRTISKDLDMSPDEVVDGLRTGRVGRCKGIDGVGHWGIFHKRSESGWKHLCKTCLNRNRKRNK